jgi:tRNA (pseudouridine54-N1)-methyltransferase
VRRFVIIGRTALASGDFSLDDLASSSGRLDALLRCVRAALLVSHGLRREVLVYLVLRGGPRAPRVVRIDGRSAKFLRPDERSLAVLLQKTLAADAGTELDEVRPGISLCHGDLEKVLEDLGEAPRYVLDEGGDDVRGQQLPKDAVFFLGDHLGFDEATLERLQGCPRLTVGPVSLHSEDVVTLLSNELDRRAL